MQSQGMKSPKSPSRRQDIARPDDAPGSSLDSIDRNILIALQEDGRLSNLELAERVGLSPSPCLRRVRRLESEGFISRYVALVDPASVGLEMTVFTRVTLDRQDDDHLDRFERAVASWPEVMECYLMTGDADFQLRVVLPNMTAYENFLRQRLTPLAGIAKIQSSFAFRPVVYRTALMLD